MLTVREATQMIKVEGLPGANLEIGFDGCATPILSDNALFMDAYGDYLVDNIDVTPYGVTLMLSVRAAKAPVQTFTA